MTTQETPETPEVQPEPEAKGLRAQNDQLRKQLREANEREAGRTITSLGLKSDEGIGLIISEQLEKGDIALDGITETATKYGHVVPEVAPQNPQAQAIQQSHEALDNLAGAAGSIAPPTQAETLAIAETEGNTDASIAIKGQQISEMLRP